MCRGLLWDVRSATVPSMKLFRNLRGRGHHHLERGDHWFLLAVIAVGAGIVAVVMLY